MHSKLRTIAQPPGPVNVASCSTRQKNRPLSTSTGTMPTGQILIIEDDADTREMVAELLSNEGYTVATACDGLEALTYLRGSATKTGLILLDLMMPNMDGVQFRCEQLKATALCTIPVALLSAKNDVAQVAQALGVAGFVRKPMEADELMELVDRILKAG